MGERVLKISKKKTEYLGCNKHQDAEIHLQRRHYRESEDIHMYGIDVGGGWRTWCGSQTQITERVEELERVSGVLCDRKVNGKIKGKV